MKILKKELNTKIEYLYRDADNYKVWNECVIEGVLTDVQRQIIKNCLLDGEYFIPSAVGLPEKTFVALGYQYDEQVDSPYFELNLDNVKTTDRKPTINGISASQLTCNFILAKNRWEEYAARKTV